MRATALCPIGSRAIWRRRTGPLRSPSRTRRSRSDKPAIRGLPVLGRAGRRQLVHGRKDLTTTVTTQPNCTWTASVDASWLNVTNGSSGTGTGVVTVAVPDNYDAPRGGTILVRWPTPTLGQNVRIAQAGCRYAVSKSAIAFVAAGGSGTFDVIQQSDPNECGGATQDRCALVRNS